jgi:hypothetical protein
VSFRNNRFLNGFYLAIFLAGLLSAFCKMGMDPINFVIVVHAVPFTPGPYDTVPPSPTSIPLPTIFPTSANTFTPPRRILPQTETNTFIDWTRTPTITQSFTTNHLPTVPSTTQITLQTKTAETKTKSSTPFRTKPIPTSSLTSTPIAAILGLARGNGRFPILLIGIGAGIILLAILYLGLALKETRRNFEDGLSVYTVGLVLLLIGLGVTIILLSAQ